MNCFKESWISEGIVWFELFILTYLKLNKSKLHNCFCVPYYAVMYRTTTV